MPAFVNVGGTWRTIGAPAVNVGGTWRAIQSGFVNVGGTWRQFFAAAVAPTITVQPNNVSVTAGQTATFSLSATGTAPLSYQWYTGGVAISGATAPTLTLPGTTVGMSGNAYQCVVSNAVGSVDSSTVTLTVTSSYTNVSASGPGTVSGYVSNGKPNTSPAAATTTATVTANGGTGSYTYAWSYVSGKAITVTNGSTATATFSDTENCNNQTQTSVYQCLVSDGTTSATVRVTVQLTFYNAL